MSHRWTKVDPADAQGIDGCTCGAERKYAGPSRFGRGKGSSYTYRTPPAEWGRYAPPHVEQPRFDDHCGRPLVPPRPFDLRAEVLRILRAASVPDEETPPWHTLGARVLQVAKQLGWDTGLLQGVIMPGDVYMATVRAQLDRLVAEGLAQKPPPPTHYRVDAHTLRICGELYLATAHDDEQLVAGEDGGRR